ncbi:hypothetical protein NP493_6g09010 [Ridgeia piscesae]|uniref:Uncharacterized protein n=1 Tax=Ridgeia piscesae TaxID=27915 RepID=A0AAD9PFL2_RIDPI|nr:hypothetical protein NP493_6g09010 [Ridgeia piscesae]
MRAQRQGSTNYTPFFLMFNRHPRLPVELQEAAYTFFLPLYGQKGCTTMNDAHAHSYRCHKKPPPLKKLPPIDANLQLHMLRAHLQMLLWKAADQRDPPEEARNIANFGWSIEGSAITTAASCSPSTTGCS